MPSTGRPSRARRATASASPRSRSQASARTVPRVPGSTTRSASTSSSGRSTNRTTTPGSAASASTSVKFDISGTAATATRSTSAPCGGATTLSRTAPRIETRSPSSSSMPSPCAYGRTPTVGRPVRSRSMSRPGSRSDTSPRNLLTRYPATNRWSPSESSAVVPKNDAKTPPRSMSPTTTTGSRAARAMPMLTMSVRRRLISAGLPAPSQITASCVRRSSSRQSVTVPSSCSREVYGVRPPSASPPK